jgi:ABC-2 type transport system permease protein
MNFTRVRTIIEKEWAEVFKNRIVIFTIGFMPIIFTLMPLGILMAVGSQGGIPEGAVADVPPQFLNFC